MTGWLLVIELKASCNKAYLPYQKYGEALEGCYSIQSDFVLLLINQENHGEPFRINNIHQYVNTRYKSRGLMLVMLINIFLGLIIPCVILIYLFRKKPAIIALMYPLGIAIAFISNDWGFRLFWEVAPTYENNPSLSTFPFNIGYFPMLSSLFGYIKLKNSFNPHLLILLFTTSSTSLEFIAICSGKISYLNGWNICFTFFVYLIGFFVASSYINILKKYKVLI